MTLKPPNLGNNLIVDTEAHRSPSHPHFHSDHFLDALSPLSTIDPMRANGKRAIALKRDIQP